MTAVEPEPLVTQAVTALPWVLIHPYIAIGPTGTEVEFHCSASNLEAAVKQDENKVETFCGVYTSYKSPQWIITATSAMSYGTAGLWNLVQPYMGTSQQFEIRPDTAVASPTNPSMKGTCIVKWADFIKGGPGEISEVDIVLAVQGAPTFATA